jgi:putative DNA methylase
LEAHASDLNPVAVLINKALIEIPPKFCDRPPIFPGAADSQIRSWRRAQGLAADVRAYGQWIRDEAEQRIGHLYPAAKLSDGTSATVIAWIWARTVTCPNPACGIEMPLVRSWWLGKKRGKEAYVVPCVVPDASHPSGKRVSFAIKHDSARAPRGSDDGTVTRNDATCVACKTVVSKGHIKTEGRGRRLGATLMAIAAEGKRQRIYLPPTQEAIAAAQVDRPVDVPDATLSTNSQYMGAPLYGLVSLADLFTSRQLVALTTLSDLAAEARWLILSHGGSQDYGDAITTYLGIAVSRAADRHSALCTWDSSPSKEQVRGVFARQAMSMTWDIAEANPFASSSGTWSESVEWLAKVIDHLPARNVAVVEQKSATSADMAGLVLSTDPPYYDNVPYADLSDFFYGWLRRSLRTSQPSLLGTITVPKSEELVANPVRQGGKNGARRFFEDGFRQVFERARALTLDDYPIGVYYAFKQREDDESGDASTGWETLLEGMIRSGWMITATWPNRSELANRMRSVGSNALASSIVLALRKRSSEAPTTERRGFIAALRAELPDALRKLQQGRIAPVDLPQAAIGPGMAVFSRYAAVLEPDGKIMTIRSALARINEILDQVLNEQEGDFVRTTRFAIAWYRQHGYGIGKFGDADNLARARNTSVDVMARDGILTSRAGKVQLNKPADLDLDYDVVTDSRISNWEALHHLIKTLERDGIASAGGFLRTALTRSDGIIDSDRLKELAHLLFRIAEGNGWTKDALSFNNLVTSWPEILDVARAQQKPASEQSTLDFDEED